MLMPVAHRSAIVVSTTDMPGCVGGGPAAVTFIVGSDATGPNSSHRARPTATLASQIEVRSSSPASPAGPAWRCSVGRRW
jgi:hypothetical protein